MLLKTMAIILLIDVCPSLLKNKFIVEPNNKNMQNLCANRMHAKQFSNYPLLLTVYRGQILSKEEFNKLLQTKGEFLSSKNFLSTSKVRSISLQFARHTSQKLNSIGLLFMITINPENFSTPFTLLDDVSYYRAVEQEILFSIRTVF
jgi:hypothetical protein